MKVGVVGASGLVGGAVCEVLAKSGHEWVGYSRSPGGRAGEWRSLEDGFHGLDAIVNVAGDSIARRWTERSKKRFYQSRVGVTEGIVAGLEKLPGHERPKILLNASAVGFYGDQGEQVLTEDEPQGNGYLAGLCEFWEAAALKAEVLGVRVILGRIGVVLGAEADAWKRMKLIFSLGGGGKLGSGKQYWPIVHLEDVAGGIVHSLETDRISGPVNLVGTSTVTNAEFTTALGAALNRPAIFPVPAFVLKLVFGGFAQALLASYRVEPKVLEESAYQFRHRSLPELLQSLK